MVPSTCEVLALPAPNMEMAWVTTWFPKIKTVSSWFNIEKPVFNIQGENKLHAVGKTVLSKINTGGYFDYKTVLS